MQEKNNVPTEVTQLKCTGPDLRGCPNNNFAIYETRTDKTWKGGRHWVFVCETCATKLIEK